VNITNTGEICVLGGDWEKVEVLGLCISHFYNLLRKPVLIAAGNRLNSFGKITNKWLFKRKTLVIIDIFL